MNYSLLLQEGGGGGSVIGTLFGLIFAVVAIAASWQIFVKAGKPGWAAIVPIYNVVVMLEIVGRPLWWILLLLVPFVNIIVWVILAIDLAKSFGKGTGYGIGLIIPLLNFVLLLMLGFGDARYVGPSAGTAAPPGAAM